MTDLECLQTIEFLVREEAPLDKVTMLDTISNIYRIAHSHLPNHSCHSVHYQWRKLGEHTFEEAKKAGFTK